MTPALVQSALFARPWQRRQASGLMLSIGKSLLAVDLGPFGDLNFFCCNFGGWQPGWWMLLLFGLRTKTDVCCVVL